MNERIIVYSCHDNGSEHNDTMRCLRAFAVYVKTNCADGVGVEVVDGNKKSLATRNLLREARLMLRRGDGSCPFDDGFEEFVQMAKRCWGGSRPCRHQQDLSSDEAKMAALWEKRGTSEITSSFSGNVVVISDKSITSIKGKRGAHGTSRGQLCFLIRGDYRNILWHEAAHLFGADDHYDEHNHGPIEGCMDWLRGPGKLSCIMQWNPGENECSFCDRSISEMQRYFAGRISLRDRITKRRPRR